MKQPRPPKADSSRIIVEDTKTKKYLIEIGNRTGETLKDVVKRLVDAEHKKINKARM